MHAVLHGTHRENFGQRYLSPMASVSLVVNEMDTIYSHAQCAMLLSEKIILLEKKCDEYKSVSLALQFTLSSIHL